MGVFGSSLTKRTRSGCGWLEAMPSSTAAAATPIADERNNIYAAATRASLLDDVMVVLSSDMVVSCSTAKILHRHGPWSSLISSRKRTP